MPSSSSSPPPSTVQVVKARLNSNPAIEDWLLGEGLKVTKLPTLLLVKGGTPLRALTGKVQIPDLPLPYLYPTLPLTLTLTLSLTRCLQKTVQFVSYYGKP